MSSELECAIIEAHPDEWYYLLQSPDSPAQCWDWREFADAFGPFATSEEAREHLHAHHANPGGHSLATYVTGREPDQVLAGLIAEAPANMHRFHIPHPHF